MLPVRVLQSAPESLQLRRPESETGPGGTPLLGPDLDAPGTSRQDLPRVGEFARRLGVQREERLAPFHHVADADVHFDAGGGSFGAPASLALRASSRLSTASTPPRVPPDACGARPRARAFRPAPRRSAGTSSRPGRLSACAARRLRRRRAQRRRVRGSRQPAAPRATQVFGCGGLAAEHGEHVVRFERGADTAPHRLAAVGDAQRHVQAEGVADPHQAAGQLLGGASVRTFAVAPTGMSIRTWLEPAASFFDSTEATSCPSLSRSSGRSTRIRMSSAGLRRTAPPQAMQPPVRSTTRRSSGKSGPPAPASPWCRRSPPAR